MAKTFRAWNVEQQMLLPPSVLDFVPPEHLAHFVRDTVAEELDLTAIVSAYEAEERGYPPYHPVMMTALLLYAYCQRLYSSRRIARACEERVDFMAVTALQRPDFRTIATFRRRHLPALRGLFQQVLGLCRRAGLVRLGHVALDGTKIRANASKHKAMSYQRMQQAEPELAAEVARWLAEAEATDRREDTEHGADQRGDTLPAWVANKQERLAKIRAAKAALEAEARAAAPAGPPPPPAPTTQRNFTDPESRIMKGPDGFLQAYNAQIAVDAGSQVIVAQHVTAAATDVQALPVLLAEIKANTGRQAQELSADAGYCSTANLRAVRRRHIRGYIAVGRQRHGQSAPEAPRRVPGGSLLAAMRTRLKRAGHRSRYRLRKITVEPVFGQIKGAREFRQFLLRGLAKVGGEFSLVATAHNLLKLAAARAC